MTTRQAELGHEDEYKYSELAMRWHGWGSPVGIGLFALFIAGAAALIRWAFA